jgi:hypothetical protein
MNSSAADWFAPWWPVSVNHQAAWHARTRLPGDRNGLLVDVGAFGNLSGNSWVRRQALAAAQAGYPSTQTPMEKPLVVQGIGGDAPACRYQCQLPIALTDTEGHTTVDTFETPVLEGPGGSDNEVAGLLGLQSLRAQRGIIDTWNRLLHFPGPGGVQITLPPGSRSFQLEDAPSGHMMLPTSDWARLKKKTGNRSEELQPKPAPLSLMAAEGANYQ